MSEDKPPPHSWRDVNAYSHLELLDRRGFAWEYLRRNRRFRSDAIDDDRPNARSIDGITLLTAEPTFAQLWGMRFRGESKHPGIRRALVLA